MCVWTFYLHTCLFIMSVPGAHGDQKIVRFHGPGVTDGPQVAISVLGIKPRSSLEDQPELTSSHLSSPKH